jgi:hypothetical protein
MVFVEECCCGMRDHAAKALVEFNFILFHREVLGVGLLLFSIVM